MQTVVLKDGAVASLEVDLLEIILTVVVYY